MKIIKKIHAQSTDEDTAEKNDRESETVRAVQHTQKRSRSRASKSLNSLRDSETRYRRLFESAQDGIILLDGNSGAIDDANPFLVALLGYGLEELKGKRLWEIGSFGDIVANKTAFNELQRKGYIRYENLPLVTKSGEKRQVEFVSNVYLVNGKKVIQCNIRDITTRKEVEETLHISLEKYRVLFESFPLGIAITDKAGNIVESNYETERLIGSLQNTHLAQPISDIQWDIVRPDGTRMPVDEFASVRALKENRLVDNIEMGIVKEQGKITWINVTAAPIPLQQYGVAITYSDITKRIAMEEMLKSSQEKYRGIFENVQDIFFELSMDGIILEISPSIEQVSKGQYTRASLIGRSLNDFYFDPADQKVLLSVLNRVGSVNDLEITLKNKDGSSIVCSVSLKVKSDTQGIQNKIVGSLRDITDRKRSDQELIRLRLGIERSTDAFFVTDTLGIIQYVNPAFEQIYGYRSSETVGKTPRILKSEKNPGSLYRKMWSTLLAKRMFTDEIINKTKDGRFIFVEVSNNPILDEHENIIGFMGIHRDITERMKSLEKAKSLEAQLLQIQKLESLGTLASGIAHDFNNILGIIMGHSHLLEALNDNSEKMSTSIEVITRATYRGASLVKQLLTFARKSEAYFNNVNINRLVGEIDKLLKETIRKTIVISLSLQKDLPVIVADAGQIHQVLLNLCVNARDAMPHGGILSISTSVVGAATVHLQTETSMVSRYIRIEVADSGIGMDAATRQRIFEPFFTTKSSEKGTGLGLSVVFGIVENHKGIIEVKSTPGEGSKFIVYLPVPEQEVKELQQHTAEFKEIPGGKETILIIEDEEMLRELVKVFLLSKGYTVLTAADGMEGINMYRTHQEKIALVLSDIGLPVLNGQDVFKKIREINPYAKVILASGSIDPDEKNELFKNGLKNFIQKPYVLNNVLIKIREVIDSKEY